MGLFSSPSDKVKVYRIDLDPEKKFTDAYFQPAGLSFSVSGFELLEIYGFEKTSKFEDALVSKSILRIGLDDFRGCRNFGTASFNFYYVKINRPIIDGQ